jgi:hypothetical protein
MSHVSFNNHGYENDSGLHTLTISGISFNKALSSISMHDPQGTIVFDSCIFTENSGASLIINGRYRGTHTGYYNYPNGTADDDNDDDVFLQQFYQEVTTPPPITANPTPAPNDLPTTPMPVTPIPTTELRLPLTPTSSPVPTVEANRMTLPERGGYTGPPTEVPLLTTAATESFLLPTTTGTGSTAYVDPSTTWGGDLGSTTTTHSTSFGFNGTDDFMEDGNATMAEGGNVTVVEDGNGTIVEDGGDMGDDGNMGDDGDIGDDGNVEDDGNIADDGNMGDDGIERQLQQTNNEPSSIIKLQSCTFRRNAGSASILVASYYDEMEKSDAGVLEGEDDVFGAVEGRGLEEDAPVVHSIHLVVEESVFEVSLLKISCW